MDRLAKTPVTIVTGFLGAGKTTLIRHVIENAGDRRLALIVNEFGEVGVDGDILRACGVASCPEENIVELANGCLCCTVADDFIPAIEALLSRAKKPDHIIVETSGLALPKPLIKAFDWPAIRARLTVDGVIAVVDGAALAAGRFAADPEKLAAQRAGDSSIDHDNPFEEVFGDQLLCADLVVLNKIDLLDDAQCARARTEIIASAGRNARIVLTQGGRLSPQILLGVGAAAEDDVNSRPSRHDGLGEHDHDDFESFAIDLPEVRDPDVLMDRLAAVAERHGVFRIKGFVHVAGKPMRLLVQGVGGRLNCQFDRPWRRDELKRSRLVMIGEKGLDRGAVFALVVE